MAFHHFYNETALGRLLSLADISSLQLWLNSLNAQKTGGLVQQFDDQTGNANAATAPAASNEATDNGMTAHGAAGIAFNQTSDNDYYVLETPVTLSGEHHIFMLLRFDASPTDEFVLGLNGANGTSQSAGTYTDARFRWIGEGEAFNNNALVGNLSLQADKLYLIELRRTASGRELWINGALDASDTRTTSFSFDVLGNYRASAGNTSFQGVFYSLSVFDGALSDAQRSAIYEHYGTLFFGAYERGGFNRQASVAADNSRDYTLPDLAATALPAGTISEPAYIMVEDGEYITQLPTILKDHTHIYAKGNAANVQMLVDDQTSPTQIQNNSALDMFAVNASVDGGIWTSRNARYGLHNEMGASSANLTQSYKNATFIHLGNAGARTAQPTQTIWSPAFAQAGGICTGGLMEFENCTFKAAYGGISMHNQNAVMADDAVITYKNCTISIEGNEAHFPLLPWAARCESILGTQALTTVEYENCTFNKGFLMITVSAAPPLHSNPFDAKAEAIECIPLITGANNNLSYAGNGAAGIRFKQTALAVCYDNPQTSGSLFINSGGGNDVRPLIWGNRTRRELGYGNNSFTNGALDISGSYGANSLAGRLGDLRSSPRTFAVNSQIVTLDKDYRGLSNADILAEMNAQVTLVTIYEHHLMDDWRPRLDNFTTDYTCSSAQSIAPAQLVTLPNGRLAVGWDYIQPNQTGKVLFAGKVTQYTASQTARDAILANPTLTDLTVEII